MNIFVTVISRWTIGVTRYNKDKPMHEQQLQQLSISKDCGGPKSSIGFNNTKAPHDIGKINKQVQES